MPDTYPPTPERRAIVARSMEIDRCLQALRAAALDCGEGLPAIYIAETMKILRAEDVSLEARSQALSDRNST